MIKLDKSQIAQILPEYLSERTEVKCLSFAINRAMQKFVNYCGNIGVFAMIDLAPDNVLDLLAAELRTQYYDPELSLDIKRALVRNTFIWYMNSGTPAAVEELVAVVFGEGEVKEWFDYGGQPYYFKIQTDTLLRENTLTHFRSMIKKVKNLRSHLESIEIYHTVEQCIYGGAGVCCRYSKAVAITDDSKYDEGGNYATTI